MTADWHLDSLITSMGSKDFEAVLVDGMKSFMGVDHCILVQYPHNVPHPLTVLSAGAIREELAGECAALYDDRLYRQDPNIRKLQKTNTRFEPIVDRKGVNDYRDHEYRERLINRCEIVEKASLLYQSTDANYCLNLYRLASSVPYDYRAIRRLRSIARPLGSIVEKHAQLVSKTVNRFELDWIFERLTDSCGHILTARELDVCARIILGHTSESIALTLNISVNTVLTHRKHAYQKLGIGTQNQLFAIVVEGKLKKKLH